MPQLPKDPKLRQRRNRSATAATLAPAEPVASPPSLPDEAGRDWHPLTRSWWADVWSSPMASEFLQADVHGLFLLAALVDRFWNDPSTSLASEIRQHRLAFGLTPIDRRRLQWEVAKVEGAQKRTATPASPSRGRRGDDPRAHLRPVS